MYTLGKHLNNQIKSIQKAGQEVLGAYKNRLNFYKKATLLNNINYSLFNNLKYLMI